MHDFGNHMSRDKLQTAVLGLDDKGLLLLQAALETEYFDVQAVADNAPKRAEKIAETYNCIPYDDYRLLLTANQFDCLLIAAPAYTCDEYIRTAIKKKCHILKIPPPARNFEQTFEFANLAKENGIQFTIANTARFSRSFIHLRNFLQQRKIEHISLITAFCNFGSLKHPAWQTDPKLAGGGVLLQNCYPIIDQIVYNFKIPQQVYSLNTNMAKDRQQRLYLTEDTAVVSMKFNDTLIANLTANKTFGNEQQLMKIYGENKILTVSSAEFSICDKYGEIIEQDEYEVREDSLGENETCCMKKLLENFALSILSPDENHPVSSCAENLQNMALIEAAYLSARTAMPEEPQRILQTVF